MHGGCYYRTVRMRIIHLTTLHMATYCNIGYRQKDTLRSFPSMFAANRYNFTLIHDITVQLKYLGILVGRMAL